MRKKFLSVFIAMLLIMNCFPLSVIAEFEEDNNIIEVFLEDGFADKVTVEDKEYDGGHTAVVHCEDVKMINVHTSEEINGYSVWLEADGEFESKYASDEQKKVTVSGFRLEGDDKDKFKLTGEYGVVEKYAYITPQKIKVTPNESHIYYGQLVPNFSYTFDPPLTEDLQLTIGIDVSDNKLKVGKYNYNLTYNNYNYDAKIADGCVFTVDEYATDATAIIDNESEVYHNDNICLKAPPEHLISSDGINFYDEITVTLEETSGYDKKEVSYYLKNINKNSQYYMAISNEIKYSYSNKTDKVEPNITYINFRKAGDTLQNDHKSLNVFNNVSVNYG